MPVDLPRLTTDLNQLIKEYAELSKYAHYFRFAPPGHFYSPVPSEADCQRALSLAGQDDPLEGIDLNAEEQLALLKELGKWHSEFDWPMNQESGFRYYANNSQYNRGDATMLFCMLRHLQPRRIIEIGSGFNSALMLDWVEKKKPKVRPELTFIDPNPQRLHSLIKNGDIATVVEKPIQDVDLELFKSLTENDVLFIDCSHVSKSGSDVNHIYNKILPRLNCGVYVHIHDMFHNFEYPKDWILQGYQWNEQYLVRAFLTQNISYKIKLFGDWCNRHKPTQMKEALPNFSAIAGGQLWLQKTI